MPHVAATERQRPSLLLTSLMPLRVRESAARHWERAFLPFALSTMPCQWTGKALLLAMEVRRKRNFDLARVSPDDGRSRGDDLREGDERMMKSSW